MADQERFDLIVIGAGPGGYVACVRAAQLGFKVACVEKEERLGGVCLTVGCIPSKALLDSSEHYYLAKERLGEHGIRLGEVQLDLATLMQRKEQVVKALTDGVQKLLQGNQVRVVHGTARLVDGNTVQVDRPGSDRESGGRTTLWAKSILLATGSEPIALPDLPFDGKRIVTSTEALAFDTVPEHLGIVGGGYIGLELGSVWRRLGAKVSVIEMLPKIATTLDGQVTRTLQRLLARQGLDFRLGTKVVRAEVSGKAVKVVLEAAGERETMNCDRLLVAVGRRPLTRGLGLEEIGVRLDERSGRIQVDAGYRTNVPSIYAIGDLIAGPMLAHKASAEGVAAVECMAGLAGEVNYDAIPAAIYTSPEVATVGLTEEQVKERGIEYCVGTYPFAGAGRARCSGEVEGFAKIIAQARTDRILGVHILGPRASDLIAECVLGMDFGASSEDIARSIHGHPTFSEALHEAALAVRKCSIYAS